jgi:hypothetical protein
MPRLWIPLLELLGFFALICGIALWLIHDKYTMATIVMGVGAVMVIAGMLAERFIVGYHDD